MKIKKIGSTIEGKRINQTPRPYFGVSAMGEPCKRALWYGFRLFTKPEPITTREYNLFNKGHFQELVVVNELLNIPGVMVEGIEIDGSIRDIFTKLFDHKLPPASQKKFTFCSGHGGGSPDSTIILNDKKYLLEVKTSNNKGFLDLKRDLNLRRSKPEHFSQVQGYLHLMGLKKCLYVIVRKENDEKLWLTVDYDKEFATDLFRTAEKIILRPIPPERINEDSEYYRCRPYICKITGDEKLFCPHRQVCHFNARPQKTCRSCRFVEIHDKGRWLCRSNGKYLSFDKQLKGCKRYAPLKIEG